MRLKQLCTRKVRDFAMALRARKVSGAFEKRPPGHDHSVVLVQNISLLSVPLSTQAYKGCTHICELHAAEGGGES